MIVADSHILSGDFVEGTVGSREDDISGLEFGLQLLVGLMTFESDGIPIRGRSGSDNFDESLHEGELNGLHVNDEIKNILHPTSRIGKVVINQRSVVGAIELVAARHRPLLNLSARRHVEDIHAAPHHAKFPLILRELALLEGHE